MPGKRIAVLGSTGSIGKNALSVIETQGHSVCALAACSSLDALAAQAQAHPQAWLNIGDEAGAARLRALLPSGRRITWGSAGLKQIIRDSGAEMALNAISGAAGLTSTVAVLEAGIDLALANKESLVMGGPLVTRLARAKGVNLLPVDSEHSALWQLWPRENPQQIKYLWLTGSGGPFHGYSASQLAGVTPAMALNHPRWVMGPKISVDSATLMNKGLEVIEAAHLFEFSFERIKVVIHPQSLVHGLLEMTDGSLLAQLAPTDMRLPIALALAYPQRRPGPWPGLNPLQLGKLEFQEPDYALFPALNLAIAAGKAGGGAPAALNAANEVAIAAFLRHNLPFTGIAQCVDAVLQAMPASAADSLESVLAVDQRARVRALAWIKERL